jgi:hypothetical protein
MRAGTKKTAGALLGVALSALLVMTACHGAGSMAEEKYEWLPHASSPEDFPMEIHAGGFFAEDGSLVAVIHSGSEVSRPWGHSGGWFNAGDDRKAVPARLHLIWLSYAEKKTYKLQTALPKTAIAEIFRKGYVTTSHDEVVKGSYDAIMVGLAPGGVVVVWVGNGNGERLIEIGRFQATEATVTPEQYYRVNQNADGLNQQQLYDRLYGYIDESSRKRIEAEGIPLGLWDTYRRKYKWKIRGSYSEDGRATHVPLRMFNGEGEYLQLDELKNDIARDRAIPRGIHGLTWIAGDTTWQADISFDEKSIFDAFRMIFDVHKAQSAELVLMIDPAGRKFVVGLESGEHQVQIKGSDVSVSTL